ncbi:MAG: family 10 glycosylhydrolase, partial [Candidatus Marinimicrobia bacterium]|nr:family 10 glycosylhydrolase [Candidatus Neomarinimicrobiota bacterium]
MDSTITKIYLRATVSVALLFSIITAFQYQRGEFDSRYLWVVRNSLTNKSDIDKMIEFATLNRFNNILVQVRGRGDAYYKSELVQKSNLINDKEFDPLAYVIPKAKEKGIRVHAWVNTYLLWSSRIMPIQENHILRTNPEWIDQNTNKKINILNEMKKFNGGKNGIEGFYLSPNHPKVNSYLLNVFGDLIQNYDLDGLHLDYVRFHDSDYGQNPISLSSFNKQLGIINTPSSNSLESSQWNDYRRKGVTDLVRETKNLIQSIKPEIILTAAVKPNLYQARERFFQ